MGLSSSSFLLLARIALIATWFGGAFMGLGNAISGAVNVDEGDSTDHHAHHRTGTQSADQIALPDILTMPAHCMFCIDGVSPQPVSFSHNLQLASSQEQVFLRIGNIHPAKFTAHYTLGSRAPPAFIVDIV